MELPFLAIIYPATDVKGVWLSLCPEFDLMAEGNSPEEAEKWIKWVVLTALRDDAKRRIPDFIAEGDISARGVTKPEKLLEILKAHEGSVRVIRLSIENPV